MAVLDDIRAERLALVERLRGLTDEQWATPTACAGWTVRDVLGHLCTPFLVSPPKMALEFTKARGFAPAIDRVAKRLAQRPTAELLEVYEANAGSRFHPPGLPLTAPLTDVVGHSADVRWALGDPTEDWGDPARLRPALEFLTSPRSVVGFLPPNRLRGLRLVATDLDFTSGSGTEVRGPGLALVLGVLGRRAAYPLLENGDALAARN